jgi:hypothetical protein
MGGKILVGVRLDARMVKVSKGLAELRGVSLSDFVERAMSGELDRAPEKREVAQLRAVYAKKGA